MIQWLKSLYRLAREVPANGPVATPTKPRKGHGRKIRPKSCAGKRTIATDAGLTIDEIAAIHGIDRRFVRCAILRLRSRILPLGRRRLPRESQPNAYDRAHVPTIVALAKQIESKPLPDGVVHEGVED